MKRPQLISQGSLNRILNDADAAWDRSDFQKSFDLLERASRLNPSNFKILLQLGQFYGWRWDYAAAERYFEKAVSVATKKTETLATAGRLAVDFANPQMAEHYFQLALEQKDATPETFARLAEFYERMRRSEDASRMVERALQLDGNCARARLAGARLDRNAGRLEKAEQILRPVLAVADLELQIRGYYELGMLLDRQGRYDEAMKAFLDAKTLVAPFAPPSFAQQQLNRAHLKQMQTDISAEILQRWFDFGRESLQPFHRMAFLGGHARSGTTLLEQVLDSHPDIVSAEETTIFHDDAYVPLLRGLPPGTSMLAGLEAASGWILRQSRENYFRSTELFLGQPVGDRLLIDKNPATQVLLPAFVRIFPEIKIVVPLRDPRDVCLSCFMQAYWPITTSSVSFLSLATTAETYAYKMEIWRTLRPLLKNSHLEVRYEDVVEDLESVARKTLDFLEVPWDARVLGFDEHARKKLVRSPTYADVTQPVYKRAMGRWRNYQKYLEPHLEKLEPFAKAFGYE